MTYALAAAKKEAFLALKKHLGKKFFVSIDMLTTAVSGEGDVSFCCEALAHGLGRNADEVATELAAKIGPSKLIAKIIASGSSVNFYWNDEALTALVIHDINRTKKRYGFGQTGKGKHILIDLGALRTKESLNLHALRSLVYGQSLNNILRASGYATTTTLRISSQTSPSPQEVAAFCKDWNVEVKKIYDEDAADDQVDIMVKKLLTQGLARSRDGAILVDLDQNEHEAIVLRQTDGVLMYNAKALFLVYTQEEDYAPNRFLFVAKSEESSATRELAAILEHVNFSREVVPLVLEEAKMSEGITSLDEICQRVVQEAHSEIQSRHENWSKRTIAKFAKMSFKPAITFSLLQRMHTEALVLSARNLVDREGVSAAFLFASVIHLRESSGAIARGQERTCVRLLARFPDVVLQASLSYRPAVIAQYLLELAQWSVNAQLVENQDEETKTGQLLKESVISVLKTGLTLLNLPTLKEL